MAEWGDLWGEEWGGAIGTITDHGADAISRYIQPYESKQTFRDWAQVAGDRYQVIENVVQDLRTLFDIDNAEEDRQDKIGSLLNVSRSGFDTDRYRSLQKAKAEILIPNRRTTEGLLQLTRALLDDDIRTIGYVESYPKTFVLTISALTVEEQQIFRDFLKVCRPATYNGQIIVVPSPAFGFSDSTATVATTTVGYDNASAPPSFGGPYAYVLVF